MAHRQRVIEALKVVIGSYEYAAETGRKRQEYINDYEYLHKCPLCDAFWEMGCEECPSGDGHKDGCLRMKNFIWGDDEQPDRDKALARAAELREKLKELEGI